VTLGRVRRLTPLIRTAFSERNAEIYPDGKWLAYESTDSGREEVYVRPFPTSTPDGGRYRPPEDDSRSGRAGAPLARRRNSYFLYNAGLSGRSYESAGSVDPGSRPTIVVIQNWQQELMRLLPN